MYFDYAQYYKQKGFTLIPVIVTGVLIFGVGFYFYSSKPNSKAPVSPAAEKIRETYTNQNLGFKFEYSQDLSVQEDSEEQFNKRAKGDFKKNFIGFIGYKPGEFVGAVVLLEKDNSFDTNPLTIWVFDNPDSLTIKDWYEKFWYYPFVWGDFTARKEGVGPQNIATVSGSIANFGIVNYQPNYPKFIYLTKNGKMFLFRIIGRSGDQILSTFKFLK